MSYFLFDSVKKNNFAKLKKILEKGKKSPNVTDSTPLHFSAWQGHLEICKYLVEKNADVNASNKKWKKTPLILAAYAGKAEVVEFLLGQGADINAKDESDWTALHFASQEGHEESVKVLLSNNADTSVRNNEGKTAKEVALEKVIPLFSTIFPVCSSAPTRPKPQSTRPIPQLMRPKKQRPISFNWGTKPIPKKLSPSLGNDSTLLSKTSPSMEKFELRMRNLEKELENHRIEFEKKVLELTNKNQTLENEVNELKRERDSLRSFKKDYERHFDMFHRVNYSIKKHVIYPQMIQKEDEEGRVKYYCFLNDIFRYHFEFSITSGPGSNDDKQKAPIDFTGLQVLMSGNPLKNVKCSQNSIEFGTKFPRIGLYELVILFHNINRTFPIEVEPSTVFSRRCELFLYRGEVQPSRSVTPVGQPTDKFSSTDHILVYLKLVNENGIPLKKKHCEDLCLNAKLTSEGKRMGLKGILTEGRTLEVEIGSTDFNEKSEVLICTIEEKNQNRIDDSSHRGLLCLIPAQIDQDPYFRLTRDVASRLGYHKPCVIYSKFVVGLQGPRSLMSWRHESSAIFMDDSPGVIKKKIRRYAYSGGGDTVEEHRKDGANLEVDVSFRYLKLFLESDDELEDIGAKYSSGELLPGEVKNILVGLIQEFVADFQRKRREVSSEVIRKFMSVRILKGRNE